MEGIMDRSLPTSPDQGAWRPNAVGPPNALGPPNAVGSPSKDRRQSVRQKLHSPVYASFNRPQTGIVVDLSELLDLNEAGFAVQTGEPMEINRAVTLCLELPETKSYLHGSGQVIWSDDTGRGGIRFSALPENSQRVLKEWLFANLLIGCSNHAARTEQRVRQEQEQERQREESSREAAYAVKSGGLETPLLERSQEQNEQEERNDQLSALEAVRTEVQRLGNNVDAILQLITDCALHLTGASGAALAFLTDGRMVCRGRAGEPAPPLGAPVDVKHGLTGECVRSGLLISCEDLGNDPRVDPEVGRSLGIASIMAAPIVFNFAVVGLLEIFSPQPHTFTRYHKALLHRLIEMVPITCLQQSQIDPVTLENILGEDFERAAPASTPISEQIPVEQNVSEPVVYEAVDSEQNSEQPLEPEPAAPARLLYRALIGLVIVIVAMVVGYLLGPAMERRWSSRRESEQATVKTAEAAAPIARRQVKPLADLQKLAEHGDADAQWQLGVRYHNGEEVPRDDTRAMLWFLRAAEQGHVTAQATLGAYYWAGRGVPQDLSRAYFWSALALAQGDENSRSRLEGLASQMTKSQIAVARQQAEIWLKAHS
jgi:hypothetical protein